MRRLASRMAGENRARVTLLRILCAVSVWRTAMTRVLPLCGGSAWWVTLICLLPGLGVTLLLRLTMSLTGTATLAEAVRACLGRTGAWALSIVLAVLLLAEGFSGLTALTTLFTQGVGTRGTAFTLSLLTGGALLISLHREGLARAAHLLRWGMAAAAVTFAACLLSDARVDHLFPLYGEGDASVLAALKAGVSLAWPTTLLLTAEPVPAGRLRSAVLPVFAAPAALFLLALTIPQELLWRQNGLATLLLLPAKYSTNALRILYLCLLMLVIFLSIGASVQAATEQLCAPLKGRQSWLPHVLLTALILTQTGETDALWAALAAIQPWLLVPLTGIRICCLIMSPRRRKNA